ncbi:MAG: HAD hydrolase family protein [Chloroflexi bacterium]|nr:HAD hydrolase family protein [Chloroflexota bacterium]
MNIFFDMDYTLLGLDNSLRPNTREVMQRLKDDGHTLYVWSGVGIRWPEVKQHNLEPFITDCFMKPLKNFVEELERANLPVKPDLVIDDYPEVPTALGGIWVRPYFFNTVADNEMERVYTIIQDYARDGYSNDINFRRGEAAES